MSLFTFVRSSKNIVSSRRPSCRFTRFSPVTIASQRRFSTMRYPICLPSSQDPLLTLTHPSPHLWAIELHNGPDNRLTKHFMMNAMVPALDHVEMAWRDAWKVGQEGADKEAGKGGLVITGNMSQEKFFSNGLDLQAALADTGFWSSNYTSSSALAQECQVGYDPDYTCISDTFYPWMIRILTFPIPTVAAINGHAFAGGWILAAACDYRVISSGKCWGSMNEVYLGADFPHAIMVFLRSKLRDPVLLRKQLLEGHRWTPHELIAAGMVDEIVDGGSKRIFEHALALADKWSGNAKTGVYGLIKKGIYREVLEAAQIDRRLLTAAEEDEVAWTQLSARARL